VSRALTAIALTAALLLGHGQPPAAMIEGVASFRDLALPLVEGGGKGSVAFDPKLDAAADEAARHLILSAAQGSPSQDELAQVVAAALEAQGVSDAKVFPVAVLAGAPDGALSSLAAALKEKGDDLTGGRIVGLSALHSAKRAACILIAVERVIAFDELPRGPVKAAEHRVAGTVLKPVHDVQVVVQTPGVEFARPTVTIKGEAVAFSLPLGGKGGEGRYKVEVLGDVGYGPSVLNLFTVLAGSGDSPKGPELDSIDWSANDPPGGASVKSSAALFDDFNSLRGRMALPPFEGSGLLSLCALNHARDMKENGFFGHTSPTKGTLQQRAAAVGISSPYIAEVLTLTNTPAKAMGNLVASPSHLSQIVSPIPTHLGIAAVKTPRGTVFVAVMAIM